MKRIAVEIQPIRVDGERQWRLYERFANGEIQWLADCREAEEALNEATLRARDAEGSYVPIEVRPNEIEVEA